MIYAILSIFFGGIACYVSIRTFIKRSWQNEFDKFNVIGSLFFGVVLFLLGIAYILKQLSSQS